MSCLKYYTTGSLVKVITMMNESIESTESWVSLICMFLRKIKYIIKALID